MADAKTKCYGYLGMGIMGVEMSLNLLKAGYKVLVWNRTRGKCKPVVDAGAKSCDSVAEVVRQSDIVLCCLSDPSACEEVVLGEDGMRDNLSQGQGFVNLSTVDPETSSRMAEAVEARGGLYLEAPVGGSKKPAQDGKLVIMAAGNRTLFEQVEPLMDVIGKKTYFLGTIGNASRMKLCVNMILGTFVSGLAEGLSLADSVGLSQEDLWDILQQGAMACPVVTVKGKAMLTGNFEPNFPLKHQQKDLRLALAMGDSVGQPLPVAAAVNELYKRARAEGEGERDMAAVYTATTKNRRPM